MDFVSHGLWGGAVFGRKNWREFLYAFIWGIMPDVLSFGIFAVGRFLGFYKKVDFSAGLPPMSAIPDHIARFYDITHSLIVFIMVFGLVWLIFKRPILVMLAWPLHILLDIPTHSRAFFATPFLWPLSDFRFDGIPWSHLEIYLPNLIGLAIALSWLALKKLRARPKSSTSNLKFKTLN